MKNAEKFRQKALYFAILNVCSANNKQATHENKDGLGRALIYPYYISCGQYCEVLISAQTRSYFLEKYKKENNTTEILDFNLFLSAADLWHDSI